MKISHRLAKPDWIVIPELIILTSRNLTRMPFFCVCHYDSIIVLLLIYVNVYVSGQIIIFHQPRFPWNKGISLTKPPFGGNRSCEVAIISPDVYTLAIKQLVDLLLSTLPWESSSFGDTFLSLLNMENHEEIMTFMAVFLGETAPHVGKKSRDVA